MQTSQQGPWGTTDGLSTRLVELYRAPQQLSFSAIRRVLSQEFGVPLTTNSCIGRAHRLKLETREPRITLRKPPARLFKYISRSTPPTPIDPARPIDPSRLVSFNDLEPEQHCRFLIGESPDWMYCGLPPLDDGCPYCATHWRLTHTPAREQP